LEQGDGSPPKNWRPWLKLTIGVALMLMGLGFAWKQPPHPDPWRDARIWDLANIEWWLYPVERSAFKRLSRIQGDLQALYVSNTSRKLWAAGSGGLIVHSPDGGKTWVQQNPRGGRAVPTPTSRSAWGLFSQAWAADPQKALPAADKTDVRKPAVATPALPAVKAKPAPLPPQSPPSDPEHADLSDIAFIDDLQGWAVGRDGTLLATRDGGRTWAPQTSGTRIALNAVQFLDAKTGWVVGDDGIILATRDGGRTWALQSSGTRIALNAVQFLDAKTGWAVGDDGITLATRDGGQTWIARAVDSAAMLGAVQFLDAHTGWVVVEDDLDLGRLDYPAVLATRDGGQTWTPQASGTKAWLSAVQFLDAKTGWAAGDHGTLLATRDGGQTWTPQASGTKAWLNAVQFLDAKTGWAAGDHGTLLATRDGGAHWYSQTIGDKDIRAGAEAKNLTYRAYPAPWTYIALILGATLIAWAIRRLSQMPPSVGAPGIAGVFVSDEPLDHKAKDYLGHDLVAEGLANYILNRNTAPSLTLAVTGSWGSGKSSIMRRLEYRLRREGFRPAWFNAWHHQQEGRQLASMLNAIRKQAVPRWYQPAGWRVRAALYWHRGWFYKLVFFTLVGLVVIGATEASKQNDPWGYIQGTVRASLTDTRPIVITPASLEKLRKDGVLEEDVIAAISNNLLWLSDGSQAGTCRVKDTACQFDNMEQFYTTVETLIERPGPIGSELTDEEKQALREAVRHLGSGSGTMLGVLLGTLVIPLLLGKGLAVYGFNYLDLIKRLLPEHGKAEGKETVGTIERFREEFCRLTQALDERLVLFIDDLDRCDCDTVREVLELVNYLTSVGKCFVVLGMAMEHVLVCIPTRNGNQEQGGYAKQYLRKLINIEVPVPQLDLNKSRALLAGQAGETTRPADTEPIRLWAARVLAILVFVPLVAWLMNQGWSWLHPEVPDKAIEQTVVAQTLPAAAEKAREAAVSGKEPANEQQEAASVGVSAPAMTDRASVPAWLGGGMFLALLGASAWLGRRRWLAWLQEHGWMKALKISLGGAERKQDSVDFVAALTAWHPVIAEGDPTPRGIKRFVNRVRFLAMMEQAQDDERIPDALLVALAALHHSHAQLPADITQAADESYYASLFKGESKLLNEMVVSAIEQTPSWPPTQEQWARFQRLVEHLHVH
jgi:photosystem II stability/assembly factor-like uncharacterized protein